MILEPPGPDQVIDAVAADVAAIVANLAWWIGDPAVTVRQRAARVDYAVDAYRRMMLAATGMEPSWQVTAKVLGVSKAQVRHALERIDEAGVPEIVAAGTRSLDLTPAADDADG
jgi:hypothetical protein